MAEATGLVRRYVPKLRECKAFTDGSPSKECRIRGGKFTSTGPHHRYCAGCNNMLGQW